MFGDGKRAKHQTILRTLVGQRRISTDCRQLFCKRRQCKRLIVINYERVALHPSVRLRTHRYFARRIKNSRRAIPFRVTKLPKMRPAFTSWSTAKAVNDLLGEPSRNCVFLLPPDHRPQCRSREHRHLIIVLYRQRQLGNRLRFQLRIDKVTHRAEVEYGVNSNCSLGNVFASPRKDAHDKRESAER